jgi:ribosome biogenesis GTPase
MTGVEATVVAAFGRRGRVEFADARTLPFLVPGRRLRIVCGDRVLVTETPGHGLAVVVELIPRRTVLARETGRDEPEVIAANLEQLLVVCAPEPGPDFFIVDRYLCAAELIGCRPAVVWNKVDLAAGTPPELADYRRIGYQVLQIAATRGDGLAALRTLLEAGTAAIVGQSGVGKSSLINALCGRDSAITAELSAATGEGRHTTTASLLHHVGPLGRLIDTPGVRDFIPHIPAIAKPAEGFPEIMRRAPECRFADCRHLREPDCAVKAGIATGSISARRYESYRRLCR